MDGHQPQGMHRTKRRHPGRLNLTVLCAAALCASAGQPALAQGRTDTAIVSVNYGIQLDTARLAQEVTIEKYVEEMPLAATLANKAIPLFDIGMTLRIAGPLGATVALSYVSDTDTADVTAEVPHPFYLNQLRPIAGQATVLHKEVAVHTNLAYVIVSPSISLVLSGGLSFFQVDQDFVADVTFSEAFPYDTATFTGATLTRASASKTGYNLGADVTWKVGPSWGLGGILRYARASVPVTAGGIDLGTFDVGGLQAGGGLRLIF